MSRDRRTWSSDWDTGRTGPEASVTKSRKRKWPNDSDTENNRCRSRGFRDEMTYLLSTEWQGHLSVQRHGSCQLWTIAARFHRFVPQERHKSCQPIDLSDTFQKLIIEFSNIYEVLLTRHIRNQKDLWIPWNPLKPSSGTKRNNRNGILSRPTNIKTTNHEEQEPRKQRRNSRTLRFRFCHYRESHGNDVAEDSSVARSIQTSRYKSLIFPLSLSLRQLENRVDPELFARTILPCRLFLSRGFIGRRNRRRLAAKLPAGSVYASVIDAATPNASHDANATCKNDHCREGKERLVRRSSEVHSRDVSDHGRFDGGNAANGLSYEHHGRVRSFPYPDLSY